MTNIPRSAIEEAKPIGHGLDLFRASARSSLEAISGASTAEVIEQIDDGALQDLTIDLLLAVQALPVSRILPSSSSGKNLFADLSQLNQAVNASEFNVRHVVPLLVVVLGNKADGIIWEKVYEILQGPAFTTSAKPSTPPPSRPSRTASFQQTPWSFNTGSFADTSDLRKNVDPILRSEVEDNLRIDHPDVFDTFFGRIQGLDEVIAAVLQSCKDSEYQLFQEGIGWLEWPEACGEREVLQFLRSHVDRFLQLAAKHGFCPSKHRRCVTTPNKPIPGSISKRKLDVALAYNPNNELGENERESYSWSHVLIPGELKSNPREDNHSTTWFDLVRYAREILSAQDTRRFVLGFTLCGSIMRVWEFDRLGVVGSTPFDINTDARMFVTAILAFLWMSEEELGFDPTILHENGICTHVQRDGGPERLWLRELIKRKRSVAGRATTCWKGSVRDEVDCELVIKDSWEYEERPEEGLLLKEATEAGVNNVARYYYHETVLVDGRADDVLENVRKGLSEALGRDPLQRRAINHESAPSVSTSGASQQEKERGRSHGMTRKRSSSSVQVSIPPPKRSCSISPVKQDLRRRKNRVHRRLVMRSVGKTLYEASSPQGILTGLIGGINGHESLLDAKILHRDISIGNVMLTIAEDDGFLIDLDLAIKIDREGASGAPSKTGTKVFMAIGALYGEEHTFMHDLESFFWVLYWICVHCNGPRGQRRVSKFEAWNFESTETLAKIKAGSVLEESKFVEEAHANFTEYCMPLVSCMKGLREVVFPDGKRWQRKDRQLYVRMTSILQQALNDLGKGNGA
ncbi:hypothetical protein BS50DRAFT_580135 [Corynespora cassiicola Philippines]|uniref:Fungal-type protein kinase domain-containing protein n=1 Tax=Corynespora cassiicola Philippines TaxID=1448308 RepID=A0A2T2N1E7_CORCC|nr:hypothetical protein BS50DRAFT_580135 [Corynespora cassiicola Philippines]